MKLTAALFLIGILNAEPWKDPSKHAVHFVTVEEGVQLEVLDWGGSGRSIVLLTGSGNTAHVYDDFAAKLADCCHVYAITRRGFGHSSHPQSGYTDQRLADDVLSVLDALKIEAPVLVGHSMAGAEITTLGSQHSDRLSGLVYLDAGADPVDFPWSDPAYRAAVQKTSALRPPKPVSAADRKKSFQAYRVWQQEAAGFVFCEAEIRNMYDFNADGSIGAYRTADPIRTAIDKGAKKRDYSNIRVPVLSIFATPSVPSAPVEGDPAELHAARQEEYTQLVKFIGRYKKSLLDAVPKARVLDWPGATHYLYITQEQEVLRDMKSFVAGLR